QHLADPGVLLSYATCRDGHRTCGRYDDHALAASHGGTWLDVLRADRISARKPVLRALAGERRGRFDRRAGNCEDVVRGGLCQLWRQNSAAVDTAFCSDDALCAAHREPDDRVYSTTTAGGADPDGAALADPRHRSVKPAGALQTL